MKMDSQEVGRRSTRKSRGTSAKQKNRSSSQQTSSRANSQRTRGQSGRARSSPGRGGSAKSTTNLEEIRRWAEERGGNAVSVKGTASRGPAGLLPIAFPDLSGAARLEASPRQEMSQK